MCNNFKCIIFFFGFYAKRNLSYLTFLIKIACSVSLFLRSFILRAKQKCVRVKSSCSDGGIALGDLRHEKFSWVFVNARGWFFLGTSQSYNFWEDKLLRRLRVQLNKNFLSFHRLKTNVHKSNGDDDDDFTQRPISLTPYENCSTWIVKGYYLKIIWPISKSYILMIF